MLTRLAVPSPRSPRPRGAQRPGVRAGAGPVARPSDGRHEDRPARRRDPLPRRRRRLLVADLRPRPHPGWPIRRLPAADGPVLRARRRARRAGLARAAALARLPAGARRLRDGAPDGRAPRPPARRRARGGGAARPAEPVRGRLLRPHDGDAARLCGAAVAVAGRPPRPARAARLVVAGRVRGRAGADRRRGQRRRDGVGAGRAAAAGRLRALDRRRRRGATLAARLADGVAGGARLGLVDRPGPRARDRRRRLPALHRAARDDLVDHQPARVAALDGLLDLLPRGGLRR